MSASEYLKEITTGPMVTRRIPESSTSSQTCHGAVECTSAEMLALGAAVFLLFFLATVVDLRDALEVVDAEHDRLKAEADAFGEFVDRVADIDASRPQLADGGPDAGTLVGTTSTAGLEQVREAYRNTVMDVAHYESEYDEPLVENMVKEFGDDVAAAVVGDGQLTPELKETILQRSRQSREKRLVLAEHLEEESGAVASAKDALARVARSVDRLADEPLERYGYDDLRAEWYLLADRIEECETLLDRRQERIQDRQGLAERVDGVDSFEAYVYEPLSVTYPVLARATGLLEQLDRTQQQVARTLANRE